MDIAIIGSGIGGLASAIFLARQGHDITIYEQAESPRPVGAGFLLQPPGQAVLRELGVHSTVSQNVIPIKGLQSKTLSGKTLLDLSYADLKDGSVVGKDAGNDAEGVAGRSVGWGVQRSTIFDALYSSATQIPTIDFKWNQHIERCQNESGRVLVQSNSEQYTHELVILASGTHSQLPDHLFPKRRKAQYAWGCLWSTLRLPATFSSELLQQRCKSSAKMMGILPVKQSPSGIDAALYWSMPVKMFNTFNSHTYNSDTLKIEACNSVKKEMIHFWPELSESIQHLAYEDLTCASYNDVWTPYPINGQIIALGDACHGTSPQLGQGCTMALLDALSLSRSLGNDALTLDQALHTWWHSRKNQLAYVRHISRFLTPLYQSNSTLFGKFRDNIMAPMGRLPGLYTLQLKTLASEVFLNRDLFNQAKIVSQTKPSKNSSKD